MPIHGRPGSIPARPMPEIPIAETPQSPLPADGPPARSGALIGEIVVELGHAGPGERGRLRQAAAAAPVVKLVNSVSAQAGELGTSDVQCETSSGALDVRLRVDGVMVDRTKVPARMAAGVVSRLKIRASLG